jgi:hypothetical protein
VIVAAYPIERRFAAVDPGGMWVDVVEQIEPEPGWWDRHS